MSEIDVVKKNCRYLIKDSERGHRPKISEGEKTYRYTICLPKSLKQLCLYAGAIRVRKILKKGLLNNEDNIHN